MVCSGKNTLSSGKELGSLLKNDVSNAWSKVKGGLKKYSLSGNNGGFVDLDAPVLGSGKYSNLKDSKSVGAGKKFTSSQKKKIIQQNMEKNGGVIKSDLSDEILVPATKNKKDVTPNPLEVQIDHIFPKSKGGSNSYSNAQVLSRIENIKKSDK